MKRGKHYRRCNVINSSLAPISHARQRRKEVPNISINMNFSQLESTWMKKKIMKKVCFHSPLYFQNQDKYGGLGTGKTENTDNIVSISLYMAPELYRCLAARQEDMKQGLQSRCICGPYSMDLWLVPFLFSTTSYAPLITFSQLPPQGRRGHI